jgi:GAF domain-containing protein
MRKRVAIHGATEEALRLLPTLEADPDLEIALIWDEDLPSARARFARLDPTRAEAYADRLSDDPAALGPDSRIHTVIDASRSFARARPAGAASELRVLSPLSARLLWGRARSAGERKSELLAALREVVDSLELSADAGTVAGRILDVALGATRADAGSVMLLDPETRELRVRVAIGIEPELWAKIRVPLGEGIAGRVAAEGAAVRVSGRADARAFQRVRERVDVEAALSVPLRHAGETLGVLNLSHHSDPDALPEADLGFVEQLASLAGSLLVRAREQERFRDQAGRYDALHDLHAVLGDRTFPLPERLARLCRSLARRLGGGIATLYLYDREEAALRLEATSLAGGGFGGEYRVEIGHGIDGAAARDRRATCLYGPDGRLAYAALPLVVSEGLVGLLSLQAGERSDRLGPRPERALAEIASAAAAEVANAAREARLASRATRIAAMNELALRILREPEPNEVIRLASGSIAMILECDHVILRLRDDTTGRFVIRSYYGPADGRQQERLFRLDQRISAEVVKTRSACRHPDLEKDDVNRSIGAGVRSSLTVPLQREGRVVGTIALYDKAPADRFHSTVFSEEDLELFGQFASYVERGLAHAAVQSWARQHPGRDAETDLASDAYMRTRLDEELARSAARGGGFVVGSCRVENWAELREAGRPEQATRVIQRVAEALRRHVRPFDVLARSGESEVRFLLPDPEPAAGEQVSRLARRVAEAVAGDESLNAPVRIALAFGYAACPEDGDDAEELLRRAAAPRIRTV